MSTWCIFHLTVVDCGTPTNPVNGQVSHTSGTAFGHTATYICNTGYNLVGSSTRMCQATGAWSGSEPTCQRMNCIYHETTSSQQQMLTETT